MKSPMADPQTSVSSNPAAAWSDEAPRQGGWWAATDPRVKLVWLSWVSLMCILVDSREALLTVCLLAIVPASNLRLSPRGWGWVALILGSLVWGTVLSQGLFYDQAPRTVLITLLPGWRLGGWELGPMRMYREGAAHGLTQSLRMLSLSIAGLSVSLSTRPEKLLAGLVRLRCPPALAFMTAAALRFLPLVLTEWRLTRQARWLRGYRPGLWPGWFGQRWLMRLRMELVLLVPLLANTIRRATVLATSVSSRGFDPAARRSYYPALKFTTAERLILALLAISAAAVFAIKLLYWLYLGQWFYDPRLAAVYELAWRWL